MTTQIQSAEKEKAVSYETIKVSSTAFQHNGFIPIRYTGDGKNVSPALNLDHIPKGAKTLAIIVDDPDAPVGTWVHWVIWNIPVTHHLKENNVKGEQGINDFSKHYYCGPCPPRGIHRYFFKVYALDHSLDDLSVDTNKKDLEKAMSGHILGFGELIGLYKRE